MTGHVEEIARLIKDKKIRGSTTVAEEAIKAIIKDCTEYDCVNGNEGLRDALLEWYMLISTTRPGLITLQNGLRMLVDGIENVHDDQLLDTLCFNAELFFNKIKNALDNISAYGGNTVRDNSNIMIVGHSIYTDGILDVLKKMGKTVTVYVPEMRPRMQGLKTLRASLKNGFKTILVVDSAVMSVMKTVDFVFTAGDTICSDGSVKNTIGSLNAAIAAHMTLTPMMVTIPTFKFSSETLYGTVMTVEDDNSNIFINKLGLDDDPEFKKNKHLLSMLNPAFDIIPPEYIRSVITESYIMSPYSIGEYIQKL